MQQLLHIPDIVERLGPLWIYSFFEYENLNIELLRLVHGTCHIDTQIARSQHQFIRMIKFIKAVPDGPIRNFCQKKKRQVKIIDNVFPHCYGVGIYKHVRELPEMIQTEIYNLGNPQNFQALTYSRLLKNGTLYVTETYQQNLTTYSSAVQYVHNLEPKLGILYTFIRLKNCDCALRGCQCAANHYAILGEINNQIFFNEQGNNDVAYDSRTFLHKCNLVNNFKVTCLIRCIIAISVGTLTAVCIYINIADQIYVRLPVNQKERK